MPFYQLTITTNSAATDFEAMSDLLFLEGADAVTLEDSSDDPILEPLPQTTPLWQNTQLTALFQSPEILEHALAILKLQFPEITHMVSQVEDQDWVRNSLAQFKPMCFADRLWIYPSWDMPPEAAEISMQLDPGVAFGTGTHPTTAMCLEWLAQHDLHSKSVIDFGCGSGILSIAALKLGANSVIATDIDKQALTSCHDNAVLNSIDNDTLHIMLPSELPNNIASDILIANILAQPIIELRSKFISMLKKHGVLLLTGVLIEQEDRIISHYRPICDLQVINRIDNWSLLYGKLKNCT